MSSDRNNYYREEFFKKYPDLKNMGNDFFNTKLWILLLLHTKSHTMTEISSKSCKSLKEECPTYETLENIISNELFSKRIITTSVDRKSYELMPNIAFGLSQFKNDADAYAGQKGQHLYNFIKNCAAEPILDSSYEKSSIKWKKIYPEILGESAKGTIRVMLALVFGA